MLNNIKTFISKNRTDLEYICLLVFILLLISIPKLLNQYHVGIANWDTYLYLENGRNFAKMGWGDVPSIAPVLPMMMAKIFLFTNHLDYHVIFNLDVVFYIVGVISLYLLLRYKFDYTTSLLGCVIYATFTLLYSWVAVGGNDIIGVSGTLLSMYLILAANKYNKRLYVLAFIFAGYSFLARYTAGVMIFAIAFFFIINRIDLKEIFYVIVGAFVGFISIAWFFDHFNRVLDTPFPFLEQFTGTVNNTPVLDSGYLPNPWYFIQHIPNYLSSTINDNLFNSVINPMGNTPTLLAYIYIGLMILGFISIIYAVCSGILNKSDKTSKTNIILFVLSAIFIAYTIITLNNVSYIISTVLFMIALIFLYFSLYSYDIKKLDYEFLMIYLLFIYVVFQSILSTKNDRYFITVLPFIAYFITCGINWIYSYLDGTDINRNIFKKSLSKIISIIIIAFLIINTFSFLSSMGDSNEYLAIEDACSWLEKHDNNITNTTIIYSDNWPAISWYMNMYGQRGVIDTTNESERLIFSYEILADNDTHHAASYYIDTHNDYKGEYKGFTKVYEINNTVVYKNDYRINHENINNFSITDYRNYYDNLFSEDKEKIGDIYEQLKK